MVNDEPPGARRYLEKGEGRGVVVKGKSDLLLQCLWGPATISRRLRLIKNIKSRYKIFEDHDKALAILRCWIYLSME
jgi:hypothetical protein